MRSWDYKSLQKVVLDSISGHDFSRHTDPVSSVHYKTDSDVGRKSPQDHRGVSFIPGPPSCSLASSSGPPFVPYSSVKGWDVKDAISPGSPQVQVGLSRRVTSHPLGSSVSGGSFMVVLGDSTTRGRRSFSPSARLELLLGRVRRRLGRHRRGKPSVRSLDSKPKGTLHQPQGDDGSAERPLRVQLSSQRQDDRSLLRQCHDSCLPQVIGRHEVSGPVPQSEEQGSLNTRADLLSRPNLVIRSGWTLHQEVVQDLLHQWPAIIDLFTTSLTARLPVFFAPAWEPKAAWVVTFLQPWDNLQAYAFPPIAIIKRVLLKLRASHNCDLTSDRPLLASKGMVSRSTGTSIRHSNRTTQTSRSAATTVFPSVSRKSPYASSDCVATLKRFASQAGFSETVAGQLALCGRESTRLNLRLAEESSEIGTKTSIIGPPSPQFRR